MKRVVMVLLLLVAEAGRRWMGGSEETAGNVKSTNDGIKRGFFLVKL